MKGLKSKSREIIYLVTNLHGTLLELLEAISELDIEIDNKLEQKEEEE